MGQVITAASFVAVSRIALIVFCIATVVFVTLDVTLPLIDDLARLGMHIQLDPPARLVGGLDLIAAAFTFDLLDISIAGGFQSGVHFGNR
ncbi:MAG: hypothetical protein BGO63_18660 [Candidatus Accumulibacter sp. 66-26]|nr:MAG: hypothetical protein BGO63_18660 [Candidatus Accumulibacter sp. 66-26]